MSEPVRSPEPVKLTRREAEDTVYWLNVKADGFAPYCAGVSVAATGAGTATEPSLGLDTIRQRSPAIFFLPTVPPSDLPRFEEKLRNLLAASVAASAVVWLENPGADRAEWRGALLPLSSAPFAAPVNLRVGGYTLTIDAGVRVEWTATGLEMTGALYLTSTTAVPNAAKLAFSKLELPLAGPAAGCLTGTTTASGRTLTELGLVFRRRLDDRSVSFPLLLDDASLTLDVQIDALKPFVATRSCLRVTNRGGWTTGFIAKGQGTTTGAAVLVPVGADGALPALRFGEDGGLAVDGTFLLDAQHLLPATATGEETGSNQAGMLLCGLDSREWLELSSETRLQFRRSAAQGMELSVGDGRCDYMERPRQRGPEQAVTKVPLAASLDTLPILPYGATRDTAAVLDRVEAEQMKPLRRNIISRLTAPFSPASGNGEIPDETAGELLAARLPTASAEPPPPPRLAAPPPNWSLPGTRDENTIGSVAVFRAQNNSMTLELSGLSPEIIRLLAFFDKRAPRPGLLLTSADFGTAKVKCRLTVGATTVVLDPDRWKLFGGGMVIRIAGALDSAANQQQASLLRWCNRAPRQVSELCRTIFDDAGGGVVVLDAQGPPPQPATGWFGGLFGHMAAYRQPLWSIACGTKGPPAATVAFFDSLSTDNAAGIRSVAVTAMLEVSRWSGLLELTFANWLRHPCSPETGKCTVTLCATGDDAGGERVTMKRPAVIAMAEHCPLQAAAITSVTMAPPRVGEDGNPLPVRRFILDGLMAFRPLPTDVLSFGDSDAKSGLGFTDVILQFDLARAKAVLSLNDSGLTCVPRTTVARTNSLFHRFPLGPPEWVRDSQGKAPSALGYTGVLCAGSEGAPGPGWVGLRHRLDLGALTSMTAAAGISAELLIAWQPESPAGGIAVGLKLPGIGSGNEGLALGDLIRIGFRNQELLSWTPPGQSDKQYGLRLQELKASLLGFLEFPPGRTDLTLIGNPDRNNAAAAVGWFAAYTKP